MRQLIIEDRWTLYGILTNENVTNKEIASRLGVSEKTIKRERKRWDIDGKYAPKKAQDMIDKGRDNNAISRIKLLQDDWLRREIESSLDPWISTPDSITGRKKLKGEKRVCTKTIYNYATQHDPWWKKKLTYKKGYKKRHSRKWKRPEWYRHISTRSKEADERTEIGHMEIDLVMSNGKKAWIMTLVDRKSRFWLITHVESKHINSINTQLIHMFENKEIQKKLKTITSDNWHEFFWLKHLEKTLWFEQYYADPYCSWQRGTNEQYNGQIRKLFPKWTDFTLIAVETIKNLQSKLNKKPRKNLWYRTPEEVFFNTTMPD